MVSVILGSLFNDMRHGYGVYTWPDGGKYEGYFQFNLKSGFGTFIMKNGDQFQGMYQQDQRSGPGIFTYKESGAQDVGIWKGSKLIQLCTVMNNVFLYANYADHSINAAQKVSLPQSKYNPSKLGSNLHTCFEDVDFPPTFPRDQILKGIRGVKSPKGLIEETSESFIQAVSLGDFQYVKSELQNGTVDTNVCDSTGYSSILAAAVNCHLDVLNCLLDYGANINFLTNEGLSALSACHILLYAEQNFLENIAETIAKENLFNTVEIEKRTGTVINRNDRKKVMSVYEASYATYSVNKHRFVRLKAAVKASQESSQDLEASGFSSMSKSQYVSDDDINEEDSVIHYDQWKMDYYQKSIQHVKEVENINKTFQIFMLNPTSDNEEKLWCSKKLDVSLANIHNVIPQTKDNMVDTTVASICGYDAHSHKSQKTSASRCNKLTRRSHEMTKLLYNERKPHLQQTIELLLKRGADPNASDLPMPALFFAVKSADVAAVLSLLKQNAQTDGRMKTLNLSPLHVAVALPCPEALTITDLLLKFGADPNLRDGYLDGRTALHIVCTREDDFQLAQKIAESLLAHRANPNLLCGGNSALSLAISSGNDLIFDTLLKHNTDLSLKLTHGLGSALAVAASFQAERHRTPCERIKLIDRLVQSGADMLTPVRISDRFPPGTVVDYAYHVFTQDRRIACTPYHALSSLERECFNARKYMLEKLGTYLRLAALRKEEELGKESNEGWIPESEKKKVQSINSHQRRSKTQIQDTAGGRDHTCGLRCQLIKVAVKDGVPQYKKRLRYCYSCGRSIGVRLSACTRCKEVFYCSKNCKMKAWHSRHRDECGKTAGVKFRTDGKSDSPTPTTNALDTHDTHKRPKTTPAASTTLSQTTTHLRRKRCNTTDDKHFLPKL